MPTLVRRDPKASTLQMLRNKTLENPFKKHDNIPLYGASFYCISVMAGLVPAILVFEVRVRA